MNRKVKLKDNLVVGQMYGNLYFTTQMERLKGKELTVIGKSAAGNLTVKEMQLYISPDMVEKVKTPYQKSAEALIQRQIDKGLEHYGHSLEDWDSGIIERIDYLEEELADGIIYCEHIKAKLREMGLC